MEYNDCVACGFKCEKVCPVSRGTKKYCLRAFLEKYLGQGEAISWPCMGCRACELVCPGEKKPHQLVIEAMQRFLKTGENTIT
nr:hypothetical protein [Candidatus Sigynarchaeota archaeon]